MTLYYSLFVLDHHLYHLYHLYQDHPSSDK